MIILLGVGLDVTSNESLGISFLEHLPAKRAGVPPMSISWGEGNFETAKPRQTHSREWIFKDHGTNESLFVFLECFMSFLFSLATLGFKGH